MSNKFHFLCTKCGQKINSFTEWFGNYQKCPKCGSPMVLRTAQKGPNSGNQFWGCSKYPKCKMTLNQL